MLRGGWLLCQDEVLRVALQVAFEPNAGQEPLRFEAMHWAIRTILQYYVSSPELIVSRLLELSCGLVLACLLQTKPAVLEGLPSLSAFVRSDHPRPFSWGGKFAS